MKKLIILLTLLLTIYMFVDSMAQKMQLVYNVENTGADCPIPYLPALSELPSIQSLPDPYEWADGRGRMSNFSDWRYRRAEIGAQIQNYEIGQKPVRQDTISASYSAGVLTVNVTVNGKTLTLTSQINLPGGSGPFPAVIGMNSPSGSIPSSIFSSRNIAQITFNHDQVTTYGGPSTADPYYKLYPNLNPNNTGQYSAWAWGVSRLIDGLELVQNVLPIDLKHIAVTGCSYAGKLALFAGAFDERVALTIAQESGGGGATSWRYSHSEPNGTVEDIDNTDYNWFADQMKQFSGNSVSNLPEDHHELMALCAPRALLVTANPDYTWLSNPSCNVCSEACKQIYNTLGISDRFGYSIVGGHMHCAVPNSQIPEVEAFVDKFLLGKDTVNTNIATTPYNIDLSAWITWTGPALANDTSFFGKASLAYPSNLQTDVDTNAVTLKWNKLQGAIKYYIQLSTDQAFKSIIKSDSTTADTLKTFNGLSINKRYYWRVQAKSSAGFGPWSVIWSFVTKIVLPGKVQTGYSTPYPNRADYIILSWNKVINADQYLVQTCVDTTFTNVFVSGSTSDTTKILHGFSSGQRYYWRVQAINNVGGSGVWSNTWTFSTILAPTNLVLQRSALTEITLTWTVNAVSADGYVIERKQSPQTSFSVLDTLKGNGNEYVDKNAGQTKANTYRVKAYLQSTTSDYSDEATLNISGVNGGGDGIPKEYSVSQNYPNPFNPTTTIKFALPQSAVTKIIVYDVLGREIQPLINKELKAGYHEVNFYASNLPSGVYFYRIQSGNFISTKKMILLK